MIADTELRLFKADDVFTVPQRGEVWTGPCPFEWDKREGLEAWRGAWLISHPLARHDTTYRVVGVESYCVQRIKFGVLVGILVVANPGTEDQP